MATVDGFAPSEIFDTGIEIETPSGEPEDLQSIVKRQIEEALAWRAEHLDKPQEKATNYYHTRPFGADLPEVEGRSQVVTSEVRDTVSAMLPSLMRVFFGSERVVEFKPRDAEDIETAKQQTEYVNYIVLEDNPGFLTLYSGFKDALIRKMGVVQWWWEDKETVDGSEHTGLTAEQVTVLQTDPTVEITEILENPPEIEGAAPTFDVVILRTRNDGRVRIAEVPNEEFIFSPSARSLEDARMVGRVRDVPADELVAMGVPDELVDRHKGRGTTANQETLRASRQIDKGAHDQFEDEQGSATRPVRFAEVYTRLDADEDGIAELRKVLAIGDSAEIWHNEVVDDIPFAVFGPDPEPHTMVGLSVADLVMDFQRIGSAVTRGMLDSLTQTLNPVTEVVESQVNMKDVLNKEVGRIVRVDRPGMMREVTTPFVGADALPVLQHLDSKRENATGISKAAVGLDADALQSSTRAAVAATVSAAQQRMELIARIFAETGMKQLMRGVLRTVVQHQDEPRVVRLRNEFVRVDPRHWDADKDVVVNVALGTGLVEEKLAILEMIAAEQKEQLLAGSPIVGFSEYRNTLARIVELAGFRNSQEFWKPFGPQEEEQLRQSQAQSQEPSPEERLERIEMAKIQARQQEKQMEMQIRLAELELERFRVAREVAIKEADVDRKAATDATDAAIRQAQTDLDAQMKAVTAAKTLSDTRVGE